MARFSFFFLLLLSVAFGTHIYLAETRPPAALPREINPDALKIVSSVVGTRQAPSAPAAKKANDAGRPLVCMDFAVSPANVPLVEAAIAEVAVSERVSRRNIEEFSKYLIALPPLASRKAAIDMVAQLKKAGIKELQVMSNNGIALGAFASEEAATFHQKGLVQKAAELVKAATITPRSPVVKETLFSLRDIDTNAALRLTAKQREIEGSTLKEVACTPNPDRAVTKVARGA